MEIHHTKHHQTYVHALNQAIAEKPPAGGETSEAALLEELLRTIGSYGPAVRNNGGGHFNHTFFWESLTPTAAQQPNGSLGQALDRTFGSFDGFKQAFTAAAINRFGSGWAWLSLVPTNGSLRITSTANQDNPYMQILPAEEQGIPLLGLDVWEHAYYLLHQNRRLEYVAAFWHVIDWACVAARFERAMQHLEQ